MKKTTKWLGGSVAAVALVVGGSLAVVLPAQATNSTEISHSVTTEEPVIPTTDEGAATTVDLVEDVQIDESVPDDGDVKDSQADESVPDDGDVEDSQADESESVEVEDSHAVVSQSDAVEVEVEVEDSHAVEVEDSHADDSHEDETDD